MKRRWPSAKTMSKARVDLPEPETPVTTLSPHAAEPIDDWDDWDDDDADEEPVVVSGSGIASLVDAVRAELGAEASSPRLSFF